MNPDTGAQKVISSGGQFIGPTGIALAPTGELFIADSTCCGEQSGVIRVDPSTGAQTVVAGGGNFSQPMGITFVQPPPLAAPVPGAACAARGAVCHTELGTWRPASGGSTVASLVATGSVEPGPCPPTRARSCLAFATLDSFTVHGTIRRLQPGQVPIVHVPVMSAAGDALGVRELRCEPADSAGRARCRVSPMEEGVFPRQGGLVRVRAVCLGHVRTELSCRQAVHP